MAAASTDDPTLTPVDNSINSIEIGERVSDNLAFVLREKRHFLYETRPMPALPSKHHVIVAVCTTGICGSDVRSRTPGMPCDYLCPR